MNFSKIDIDNELFELYQQSLYLYKNHDDWRINVFLYNSDTNGIKENWSKISSSISAIYQSDLVAKEDEFEKWNIYIIYVSKEKVSKALKQKIESDKFSSRKIIKDNFTDEFTDTNVNKLLVKYITNDDLIVEQSLKKSDKESANTFYIPHCDKLWNSIPENNIKGKIEFQKQILSDIVKSMYNED